MKKVFLIVEEELGENLCELLNFAGFFSQTIGGAQKLPFGDPRKAPDLFICLAQSLRDQRKFSSFNYLNHYPYILLCEDGLPQMDFPNARQYLQIPCSDSDLLDAVNSCLGTQVQSN